MNKILIFIILLIIYLIFFVKKSNRYEHLPMNNYNKIKHKFKTGDIILFSCKIHSSFINNLEYYIRTNFIGSEYGHVGIILKINNGIYLVECTGHDHIADNYAYRMNDYGKGGVRIIDFEVILKYYHNETHGNFAVKFISKEIPNKIFLSKLKDYKHIIFRDKENVYYRAILDVAVSHDLSEKIFEEEEAVEMVCSEFVHHFLHKCNILDKYVSNLFWPHLFTDGTFDELALVSYSEPYKFIIS